MSTRQKKRGSRVGPSQGYAWLLVLSLTVCAQKPPASDAGPPSTDAAVVPQIERYCEDSADMFCGFYLRCGRIDEPNIESCRATFVETCDSLYEPRYRALADRGLLALSAEGLAACREHLQNVFCEQQLMDLDGPCAGIWQGRAPEGAACGVGVESFVCAARLSCVVNTSLCGTCQPAVVAGENCDDDRRCVFPVLCVDGICVAAAPPGELCGAQQHCISGAQCMGGVCQARQFVSPGQACDAQHRCVYRSSCVQGICRRDALQGESCDNAVHCTSGYCGPEGLCRRPGLGGEPCNDNTQCLSASCQQQRCAEPISACLTP